MGRGLRRREFLLGGLGLAGATLLAVCGGGGTATSATGAAANGTPGAKRLGGELRYLRRGGTTDEIKATHDPIDNTFVKQTGVKVSVEPTDANADERLRQNWDGASRRGSRWQRGTGPATIRQRPRRP